MKLPTPPGPHFSVDHLMHVCSTDQFPGPETQARAIHHFALLCPRCLTALDALPALDDCFPSNPIAMALAKMVAPPAEHRELLPSHRGAIAAARSRPLGFCHLLAEEAWWVVSCNLEQGVTDLLYGFLGPILANGACLDAPREAHDLQAHLLALIAHAYWWGGDPRRAAEAVTLARAHLVWGKGEAEPKATVLAVEAQLVAWQRKPEMGWALLDEAQRLLPPYEPSPLADDEAQCREPVVRALCRLGMPEEALEELSEAHLRALVLAHHQPLAFCELLLEEARLVVQEWSDTPVKDLYAAFGSIGGNGVCLLAPREAHDLQARFFACLADAYCEAGEARAAENAAAMAEAHLARGTTAEEPPGPATGPGGAKTGSRARPRKTAKPRARRST